MAHGEETTEITSIYLESNHRIDFTATGRFGNRRKCWTGDKLQPFTVPELSDVHISFDVW